MGDDIQTRLRRLGVIKGLRDLKRAPIRPERRASPVIAPAEGSDASEGPDHGESLDVLLPGLVLTRCEAGECYVLDSVFPQAHQHGSRELGQLHEMPLPAASTLTGDERLVPLSVEDYLFLDTETTGLRGAGTFAFLVGVAYFDGSAFVVRQYFLRDHADEAAMLHLLADLLAEKSGLITFNGRTFDLPLLDSRYLMNRLDGMVGDLINRPHLDLLPPARRLWRKRSGSCSLSSLEQNILGVRRTQEDIPGWAIPGIYLDYLRTGEAQSLLRVFYHNRIDLLSMVSLTSQLMRQFSSPRTDDHPLDLLSLARWQEFLGLTVEAETSLRLLTTLDLPLDLYQRSLYRLGLLLKRSGRRQEAVPMWQQLAVTSYDDVEAHVELAKHYEWHSRDLEMAREWTQRALTLADRRQAGRSDPVRSDLEHRLARLERKLGLNRQLGD